MSRLRNLLWDQQSRNGAYTESIGIGPEFINMSYQQRSYLLL